MDKGCLRCIVKHLLKAKGYIEEAISFGMDSNLDITKLDDIILTLIKYIQENGK